MEDYFCYLETWRAASWRLVAAVIDSWFQIHIFAALVRCEDISKRMAECYGIKGKEGFFYLCDL